MIKNNQVHLPANRLPASRLIASRVMRTTVADRRRTRPTSTALELSRHRYALTPKIPVTSNDKERKLVMVDTTSVLGAGEFSLRRVCRGVITYVRQFTSLVKVEMRVGRGKTNPVT